MGNHRNKNIFWPFKFQNPNCTPCHKNDRDTWPHLLSMCEHPYLKGLRITHAGNLNNINQQQVVQEWLIECTCPQTNCQCQAGLRFDILCILGASNHTQHPYYPHTLTQYNSLNSHTAMIDSLNKPSQQRLENEPLYHYYI